MRKPQLLLVALILAQPQAGTRLVRGCKLQTNRIHGSLRLEAGMANASMFIIFAHLRCAFVGAGEVVQNLAGFEESAVARSGGGVFSFLPRSHLQGTFTD